MNDYIRGQEIRLEIRNITLARCQAADMVGSLDAVDALGERLVALHAELDRLAAEGW